MRRLFAVIALVLCGHASAQTAPPAPTTPLPPPPPPCVPWQNDANWYALIVGYNVFGGPGPFLVYHCYNQIIPPGSERPLPPVRVTIAQPWGAIDLTKLGSRIETIRKSSNPTQAFKNAWKRYVTLPLADPSLAEVAAAASAVK